MNLLREGFVRRPLPKFPDDDERQRDPDGHDAANHEDRREFGVGGQLHDVCPDGEIEGQQDRVAERVARLRDAATPGKREDRQPGGPEDGYRGRRLEDPDRGGKEGTDRLRRGERDGIVIVRSAARPTRLAGFGFSASSRSL